MDIDPKIFQLASRRPTTWSTSCAGRWPPR